ncbi:MAG: ABC transporter permease [Lachnospiraceae bacterium]|nr:ABC transporter permease [Lachnospiraceae bacterium]
MNSSRNRYLASPYLVWSAGFIIIPLIMVLYYAFTDYNGRLTFSNVSAIIYYVNIKALALSVIFSVFATLFCLLIAYPLCLILTTVIKNGSSFLSLIFILPMWMNSLLRTYAWQNILERKGVINGILAFLNLPPFYIINKPPAILLGMIYDFLPFMVLPVYNSVSRIDKDILNAARDLGADSFDTFIRIIWPLSLPGVISGITMVFVPSLTTFVISDILGGGKILLIGNVIEQLFTQDSDWNAGAGLSAILMIFIVISMFVTAKYDREDIK